MGNASPLVGLSSSKPRAGAGRSLDMGLSAQTARARGGPERKPGAARGGRLCRSTGHGPHTPLSRPQPAVMSAEPASRATPDPCRGELGRGQRCWLWAFRERPPESTAAGPLGWWSRAVLWEGSAQTRPGRPTRSLSRPRPACPAAAKAEGSGSGCEAVTRLR